MIIPDEKTLQESLEISFDGKNRVEVIKPLVYDIQGIVIVIPIGFRSDGVSNPFLLNKLDIKVLAFGLLHDYGYRTQFIDSIFFWNRMAKKILPKTDGWFTAITYTYGLNIFGWFAWYHNKFIDGLEVYPEAKELRDKYICQGAN